MVIKNKKTIQNVYGKLDVQELFKSNINVLALPMKNIEVVWIHMLLLPYHTLYIGDLSLFSHLA